MFDFSESEIAPTEVAVMDAGAEYDSQRGIHMLGLYQFHPSRVRRDVIFTVLCKALMNLPNPDFSACLSLVPEKQLSEEPLSILVQADTLLETGEFAEFWRFIEPHRGLFVGSNSGFFSAVSAFILGVIELTYRRVAKSILATSLHIGDKELAELVTTRRWAISGDDVVITEQQATLTQKRPQPSDPINLEQLSKILTALQQ